MNFKAIREELLKIDIEEFASKFNLSTNEAISMEKTNEVSLSILRLMSKEIGISVGELMKYESKKGISKIIEKDITTSFETDKPLVFFIVDKKDIVSQFKDWIQDNKGVMDLTEDVENEIDFLVENCLVKYETSRNDLTNDKIAYSETDVINYINSRITLSQNELNRLEFIILNKDKCQKIIKKAINYEPTRLIKEDETIEQIADFMRNERYKKYNEVRESLTKMNSPEYIEDLMKSLKEGDNIIEKVIEAFYAEGYRKEDELEKGISNILEGKKGLEHYYKISIPILFSDATEMNKFSFEDTYNYFIVDALNHTEEFGLEHNDVSEDVYDQREDNIKKRIKKEAIAKVMKLMFVTPLGVYDLATAKKSHKVAKSIYKTLKDYKVLDDVLSIIEYRYNVLTVATYDALINTKYAWKTYFENTINIVNKSDDEIMQLIDNEKKLLYILDILKIAFAEV